MSIDTPPASKPVTGAQHGRVHSMETCGTVDGPGLRFVLFLQGCLMRCQYCHNRDTWELQAGSVMSVDEVIGEMERCRGFFRKGGLTVSGGESLLQIDFVISLFRACRDRGIHTCIDTNGYIVHCEDRLDELLEVTDLVILDLKEMDPKKHMELTRTPNTYALRFAQMLSDRGHPTWIRHVVVPGLTDDPESMDMLAEFVRQLTNVERFELLPFHQMGEHKWKACGERYDLEGVEPPSREVMDALVARFATFGVKAVY